MLIKNQDPTTLTVPSLFLFPENSLVALIHFYGSVVFYGFPWMVEYCRGYQMYPEMDPSLRWPDETSSLASISGQPHMKGFVSLA